MAFTESVIDQAWARSGGKCVCRRLLHGHGAICNKPLTRGNRGREDSGAWEAHHRVSSGGDTLSNCEILCWECHKRTRSFGD